MTNREYSKKFDESLKQLENAGLADKFREMMLCLPDANGPEKIAVMRAMLATKEEKHGKDIS